MPSYAQKITYTCTIIMHNLHINLSIINTNNNTVYKFSFPKQTEMTIFMQIMLKEIDRQFVKLLQHKYCSNCLDILSTNVASVTSHTIMTLMPNRKGE